jgi:hypothetical protein
MPIVLLTEVTETMPLKELGLSGRAIQRLMKEVHAEVGQHWFDRMLKDHWASGAAERYGYQPRSAKYLRQKIRAAKKGKALAGGVVPLLYSGLLRVNITQWAAIHAYSTRVSVVMHGPKYVSMRPKKAGHHPNMGEEITATTPAQRRELVEFMRLALTNKLRTLHMPQTTKIG